MSATPAARGLLATPWQVRRAEEFFRTRLREAMTLSEAAEAVGCSVRALQIAFRRHRGTTPMAAFRRLRLEAARADLAQAAGAASIHRIAAAYGFTNRSRFARLCREAFGQSPSEILRSAAGPIT